MRSNHPQEDHGFIPQDPLWGILFLRLEGTHLSTEDGVFYSGHDALLRAKAKLFSATRDCKGLPEVFKRLPVLGDLVCQLILGRDGGNCSIGSVLSPHDGTPTMRAPALSLRPFMRQFVICCAGMGINKVQTLQT